MSESSLNNGRRKFRFDEMATMVNDRVDDPSKANVDYYVGLEHLDSDSLTIRRWGSPRDVEATKLRFRAGDIIFGRRRVYQRKLGVAHFNGICSAHAMVIRAKPEVALPEFLPFFMQSDLFMERAKEISVGSLSPTINWKSLALEEFVLPPLNEQRRLAKCLSASEWVAETMRRLLTRHKLLRRAAIDAFTHNEAWPKVSIGDVCDMQNGKAFPGTSYDKNGIRLMRPGNLSESGYLTWEPSKTVHLSPEWEHQASEFVVTPGDVVMNLTAQSLEDGFMGRVCLTREGDRSLLNQRIGRFCDWKPNVIPEYIFRVFQSSRFEAYAVEMCEGSKVKHIFWPYIARYTFRVAPIQEQHAIVNLLRDIDTLLDQLTERAQAHRSVHHRLLATTLGAHDVL
jgi:type I restriction enzyme, S subunit